MKKIISLLVVLAMLMAVIPAAFAAESESPLSGTIEIESYGNAEWTAPEDGNVQFTINISGATIAVLDGFSPLAEGADSVTVQVSRQQHRPGLQQESRPRLPLLLYRTKEAAKEDRPMRKGFRARGRQALLQAMRLKCTTSSMEQVPSLHMDPST